MKNLYKPCLWKFFGIALAAILAGIVNGLFGTGGGIIIVFLLSGLYAESPDYHTKDIFAMTVGAVLIMSTASLFMYIRNGSVSAADMTGYLLPAAIGGVIGAFLLDKLNAALMKKLFAALVVYAGITLIFR